MTIGHRKQLMGAVKALNGDIKRWEAQIVEARLLVERLSHHADAESGTDGIRGTAPATHEKPARKRRRRRRHVARGTMPRNSSQRRRRKPAIVEPAPVAVSAKAVRGATQFAAQLAELEKIWIAAGRNAAKVPHSSQVRGDAILRELNGRAKLPAWLTKAERMRWRRAASRPEKVPRIPKPRPPTLPITPPVRSDSGWRVDENGVRSREVVTT